MGDVADGLDRNVAAAALFSRDGWTCFMPLRFRGDVLETEAFISMSALDSAGNLVVVITSQETISDQGLTRVQTVASEKYDRGEVDASGRVSVRAADFPES